MSRNISSPIGEENIGLLNDHMSDIENEVDVSNNEKLSAPYWARVRVTRLFAAPWICARSISWLPLLTRFAFFLLPRFLQGRHAREQIRPAKLSPTAYLDGMRGLAALAVFFCHYFYQAFVIAEGWGSSETNYHFLKLPIIRIWYQGPPAVCLFFVISGYALSYRSLLFVHNRSSADFAKQISSLVFRRGIRLFLPAVISTLLIVCLIRISAYDWTRDFANDKTYMRNIVEPHPERMEFAYDQFKDWAGNMYRFIHVWDWQKYGGSTHYDVHLWAIPVEFRCSLYLFLVLIGTSRMQTKFRVMILAVIMFFVYSHSRWDMFLFLSGMALAELDHIRGAHKRSSTPSSDVLNRKQSIRRCSWKSVFWHFLCLVGLYLMCQPDVLGEVTPGWVWLHAQIPKWWKVEVYRYYQSMGAVVFAFAVGFSPSWQRFFNSMPVQYFGKISFAIYLMHGPVLHSIGYQWERLTYAVTGTEGNWYNIGFVLGACFCIPAVIWCSDIFWRVVDIPTVKFSKWLESKCTAQA